MRLMRQRNWSKTCGNRLMQIEREQIGADVLLKVSGRLDTPNAIVTLIASDGTSIQCSFGGNDAEDDTLCYLRSSGAAGVVYEVSTDALNAFAYDKAALEAEEEATPETADVAAEDPVGNDNTVDDE